MHRKLRRLLGRTHAGEATKVKPAKDLDRKQRVQELKRLHAQHKPKWNEVTNG